VIDALWRRLAALFLRRIRHGTLAVVERGRRRELGSGPPTAYVHVCSPRAWRALLRGSRGLAESYAAGWWTSPDPVAVVRLAARNAPRLDRLRRRLAPVRMPALHLRARILRNSRRRSRRQIMAHYDLGNALFARMLDATMSYSCAWFARPGMTLEGAQLAKLERVCEMLELGPEDRLLEIGTGWGGLAVYAASTRGCRVTTTTLSREQYEYARAQVEEAGLADRITVLCEDYRDLEGTYDKLVSIEMIEAVGWQHLGTFFAKCARLLTPGGAMLLQAITIDDRAYAVEKASRSFANTHVFPGGCLPSLEVIARHLARRTDMQTVDLEDLTEHYVETLRRWHERFAAHAPELELLGYDERFRRLWSFYLAYCEAGFAERRICVSQILLARPQWRRRGGAAALLAEGCVCD
jgi:cyclopropane-fatty-acyl-phospholipid synthase